MGLGKVKVELSLWPAVEAHRLWHVKDPRRSLQPQVHTELEVLGKLKTKSMTSSGIELVYWQYVSFGIFSISPRFQYLLFWLAQYVQDPLRLIFLNFALQCQLLASYGVKIIEVSTSTNYPEWSKLTSTSSTTLTLCVLPGPRNVCVGYVFLWDINY
jgi:hypothetical protein